MNRPDAVYFREETSPDGALAICYNYMEGEKSPTIVEPNVTVVATGEVIIDFWRTRLNGHLDNFTPNGFRLKVSDNFGLRTMLVQVDSSSRSFTLSGNPAAPRPLSMLDETLYLAFDSVRKVPASTATSPASSRPSILSRFARWLG